MNEYSFIKGGLFMARIAEPEKIENIKKAAMEALIEHGYGSMSIASISEKAGVSLGYLYRFYRTKKELVTELIKSNFDGIVNYFLSSVETSETAYEAGYKTIDNLFMLANSNPLVAKFHAAVLMDSKILMKDLGENFNDIFELAEKIIYLGKKTGEINSNVTAKEVLIVAFTIPFRYVSVSLEQDSNKKFTQEEAKRITEICMKALS
jgi:AcrR family transcriptional regulator